MNLDYILSAELNKAYKPVDKETEYELLIKAKAGDYKAQNDLVESQLKCIADIARGYVSYNNPLTDLMSQGTIGLIKAIHKFDVEKAGTIRFHTYAMWWIRAEITYLVYDNQPLTVPRNKSKGKASVKDDEGNIIEEAIEPIKFNVVSINAPVSDDAGSSTFDNIIPSDDIGIDKKHEYAAIMELLANRLTETEFAMFEARILDDRTYEDIGAQFNIKTREGVRQHVNKVLAKVNSIVKNRIRN